MELEFESRLFSLESMPSYIYYMKQPNSIYIMLSDPPTVQPVAMMFTDDQGADINTGTSELQ